MTGRALLQAALDYAARGFMVFPCLPKSKAPACRRGYKDATSNPATIRRWWQAQDYNIAIATGLISRVWILDVDGAAGIATLRDLKAKNGALPLTPRSITGHGYHLWFRAGTGDIQSSAGRVGDGLDVRGEGGYVLVPPSVHPDGPTYHWGNDVPIATAPDWLVALTRKRPTISERAIATMRDQKPVPRQNRFPHCAAPGSYGRAALEYEISALASTPNGSRNHALNRASFSLFQLVAGGELAEAEVINRLVEASHANGLMTDPNDGPASVKRTIASGRRAGIQHPRCRTGAT